MTYPIGIKTTKTILSFD